MTQTVQDFWAEFCRQHGLPEETPYEAWAFGGGGELADELAALVKDGVKTATTSALELYEDDEPLPQVGEYSVILDSENQPVCVIQTKEVLVMPYDQISAEYAYLEGEGDRSYQYWREEHDSFFEKEYKRAGKNFSPSDRMVCEIFEKVSH